MYAIRGHLVGNPVIQIARRLVHCYCHHDQKMTLLAVHHNASLHRPAMNMEEQ